MKSLFRILFRDGRAVFVPFRIVSWRARKCNVVRVGDYFGYVI